MVYPSLHSGWGLVIPEAMAAGMAVITTRRVEAARYYIRHRINGIIIEPNLEALVTEMERCIEDREMVFKIGKRARDDAKDASAQVADKTRIEDALIVLKAMGKEYESSFNSMRAGGSLGHLHFHFFKTYSNERDAYWRNKSKKYK